MILEVPVFMFMDVEIAGEGKRFVSGVVLEDLYLGDRVISYDDYQQRNDKSYYNIIGILTFSVSMSWIARNWNAQLELSGSGMPQMGVDPRLGVVGYLYKEIDEEDEGTETRDI